MLKTLVGAFKNKDIRKKILYTLMILVIVRVGSLLPIPGVDTEYFSSLLSGINTGVFTPLIISYQSYQPYV